MRKYNSWKKIIEATEIIKEKNLPVGKISVSLNEKYLQAPVLSFAQRKSSKRRMQRNEQKVKKVRLAFTLSWNL